MVEGVVAELADRNDVAGLMEGPDDEAGRAGRGGGEARSSNALDGRGIPGSVLAAAEPAVWGNNPTVSDNFVNAFAGTSVNERW